MFDNSLEVYEPFSRSDPRPFNSLTKMSRASVCLIATPSATASTCSRALAAKTKLNKIAGDAALGKRTEEIAQAMPRRRTQFSHAHTAFANGVLTRFPARMQVRHPKTTEMCDVGHDMASDVLDSERAAWVEPVSPAAPERHRHLYAIPLHDGLAQCVPRGLPCPEIVPAVEHRVEPHDIRLQFRQSPIA